MSTNATIKLFAIIALSILSACSSKPIIDTKGIDQVKYQQDYKECEALADQVDSSGQVAKSAVFGALVYGAIGSISGEGKDMAAMGAISGAGAGAAKSDDEKGRVLRNCLKNRGYTILN